MEAVEQCLPSWDMDGMRFVRSKVDLQVMLDESVHTPIDAAKACKIDAADIINIKLMKCGGLYEAKKITATQNRNAINRLETPTEKVRPAYRAMSQTGMAVL